MHYYRVSRVPDTTVVYFTVLVQKLPVIITFAPLAPPAQLVTVSTKSCENLMIPPPLDVATTLQHITKGMQIRFCPLV